MTSNDKVDEPQIIKGKLKVGVSGLILVLLLAGWTPACGTAPAPGEVERVLRLTWRSYCQSYISPEGRVMIPERDGGTISEAQAYALLQAVWAGDEATFARVYVWTRQNLCRADRFGDHLLAWRWGQRDDGTWGVLDWNTASDGDLDYALALLLAQRRGWQAPPPWADYGQEAARVAADILALEAVPLPSGRWLLTPGNWHEAGPPYLVNPSYFSPAYYPLFDRLRPDARWEGLRHSTYVLLEKLRQGLNNSPGVGLFPDWCRITAAGRLTPAPDRDTHFGWEAVRLPFRVALDALWHGEPRARRLLAASVVPFAQEAWGRHGRLAALYSYDGRPLAAYDSPVIYAGVLAAALAVGDTPFAHRLAAKILSFHRQEGQQAYFVAPANYYDNNWAWFGLALYAGWVRPF